MSVAKILDKVTDWVKVNICTKVELKMPPSDENAPTDAGWEDKRVNPAAFTMYVPTKEKLPPSIPSPFPSVCVRFIKGADDLSTRKGSIGIQLCFSAWNPGTHGRDVMVPDPDNCMSSKRWTGKEADDYFVRNGDGWRDVWAMVDIALAEIESVSNIDGLVIDPSVPIEFGPLTEQEAIPDYYPFWFAWVSFSILYPIARKIREVDDML